jgi:hypothetical protein
VKLAQHPFVLQGCVKVAEKQDALRRTTRTTHLVLAMHIAGLHPDGSRESMELFASQVMPQLR